MKNHLQSFGGKKGVAAAHAIECFVFLFIVVIGNLLLFSGLQLKASRLDGENIERIDPVEGNFLMLGFLRTPLPQKAEELSLNEPKNEIVWRDAREALTQNLWLYKDADYGTFLVRLYEFRRESNDPSLTAVLFQSVTYSVFSKRLEGQAFSPSKVYISYPDQNFLQSVDLGDFGVSNRMNIIYIPIPLGAGRTGEVQFYYKSGVSK